MFHGTDSRPRELPCSKPPPAFGQEEESDGKQEADGTFTKKKKKTTKPSSVPWWVLPSPPTKLTPQKTPKKNKGLDWKGAPHKNKETNWFVGHVFWSVGGPKLESMIV